MAQVVLRRLRPVGNSTKTSTYRSAVGGGKHRFSGEPGFDVLGVAGEFAGLGMARFLRSWSGGTSSDRHAMRKLIRIAADVVVAAVAMAAFGAAVPALARADVDPIEY